MKKLTLFFAFIVCGFLLPGFLIYGQDHIQLGLDIDGEAADDYSGQSVALSSDGSILAIGAYLNDGTGSNAGHVRVYA